MDNLRSMHIFMDNAHVATNVFSVRYNNHGFSCILSAQDYGYTLFISTLGVNPETIAIDIADDFRAPNYLDPKEYRILADYLGFTGSTTNRFYPSRFFEEFDNYITPSLNRPATLHEHIRAIGRAVTISEGNRIYFCGWRDNGNSGHVTQMNYEKTKKMLGEQKASSLRNMNISSRWTNIESEERLTLINEYLNMLD